MDAEAANRTYALVLAGGAPVAEQQAERLEAGAWVVAADSGLDQARLLSLTPDVVIGDMDSVDPAALAAAESAGAAVERFPGDKDATDLELALDRVVAAGFDRAIVLGGGGGRLDHLLANALLLAADRYAGLQVEWRVGATAVHICRPSEPTQLVGRPGDLVSLLAVGGLADGVATEGLAWRLAGDTLHPGSTRGVSNELATDQASIEVGAGVLLAIHERTQPLP